MVLSAGIREHGVLAVAALFFFFFGGGGGGWGLHRKPITHIAPEPGTKPGMHWCIAREEPLATLPNSPCI